MALKKLPNSFSDEQLLNLLDKALDEKIPEALEEREILQYKNDLLNFIGFYKIEPGNNRVRKSHLYTLYRKWSQEPLEKESFVIELGKYLHSTYTNNSTYFRINTSAIDISVAVYRLTKDTSRDKSKSPRWKTHFEKFMSGCSVTHGSYFIESYILYFLYDKWLYNEYRKTTTRLSYQQFIRFCILYFDRKRIGSSRMSTFGLNKDAFLSRYDITTIDNIRKAYHDSEKNKRKNKKRKVRIPSTRSFS